MNLHPASQPQPWAGPPSLSEIVVQRADRDREADAMTGRPVEVSLVEDRRVAGVDVRVYVPRRDRSPARTGAIVFLHGGGWVFGSLASADGDCRRLADRSGLVVLSVDYRLSPEHVWPAAVDDGEAVLHALVDSHADLADLGVDPAAVVVAGDSAGGFLATVLARRARDAGRDLAGQALVYPVVRRSGLEGLGDEVGDGDGLSAAAMRWYWDQFIGPDAPQPDHPGERDPSAADLVGLPSTLVVTAEHDILRVEGEQYAQALQDAGVDVVATCFMGVAHGFFRDLATVTAAGTAVDLVASWCADVAGLG